MDEISLQMNGAPHFTKLDANSGFWQIPVCAKSRLLTTFLTSYGRFCFNKLPFGISSTLELFQKNEQFVSWVRRNPLHVPVFGANRAEHDSHLDAVMHKLQNAGVMLNLNKCALLKDQVTFLGHLVNKEGIQADPEKVSVIIEMKALLVSQN